MEKSLCFNICIYGNDITTGIKKKKIKCSKQEELNVIFEDYLHDFDMKKMVINRSKFPSKIKDENYKKSYYLLRYFIRFALEKEIIGLVEKNHMKINEKRKEKGLIPLDFSRFSKSKFVINRKINRKMRIAIMIFCKNNIEKMSDKMRLAFYEEYEEELFQLNFKNDIEYQKSEVKKLMNMLISSNYKNE